MRAYVGEAVWAELLAAAYPRAHPAGSVLLRQGEPGTHVLAVISGATKVVRRERNGDLTLLAFRGPGELLGEVAVLDDRERSASVEVLAVRRRRRQPGGLPALRPRARPLAAPGPLRPRQAAGVGRARGGGDVLTRLARTLVELADISESPARRPGIPLELALTRNELAQYLGTSRNTITAMLAELAFCQVRTGRGRVVIGDLPALRAAANGDGG
ncbi:Crp/Fnr family transcriptional regulator [Streptomyces sp. M19]